MNREQTQEWAHRVAKKPKPNPKVPSSEVRRELFPDKEPKTLIAERYREALQKSIGGSCK